MPPVGLAECLRPGVRAATLCSRTRQRSASAGILRSRAEQWESGWLCPPEQREERQPRHWVRSCLRHHALPALLLPV